MTIEHSIQDFAEFRDTDHNIINISVHMLLQKN